MAEFDQELVKPLNSVSTTDWAGGEAARAYTSETQAAKLVPVLNNGASVEVDSETGELHIIVTSGLIQELGVRGKGLQPGDKVIVQPPPPAPSQ